MIVGYETAFFHTRSTLVSERRTISLCTLRAGILRTCIATELWLSGKERTQLGKCQRKVAFQVASDLP